MTQFIHKQSLQYGKSPCIAKSKDACFFPKPARKLEETPITTLRMIQDVGTGNVFVNLDTANLIMCDKGNPVDAMDVVGHLVRGVHAKDGLSPTDARNFGNEVAIGKGKVDFPRLLKQLKRVNYTGAITIEREIEGAQQTEDILKSKEYLQDLITKTYG
jgi:L-ribulose-5-phosphate 3-epimerase